VKTVVKWSRCMSPSRRPSVFREASSKSPTLVSSGLLDRTAQVGLVRSQRSTRPRRRSVKSRHHRLTDGAFAITDPGHARCPPMRGLEETSRSVQRVTRGRLVQAQRRGAFLVAAIERLRVRSRDMVHARAQPGSTCANAPKRARTLLPAAIAEGEERGGDDDENHFERPIPAQEAWVVIRPWRLTRNFLPCRRPS
jgi:hypothetical protein